MNVSEYVGVNIKSNGPPDQSYVFREKVALLLYWKDLSRHQILSDTLSIPQKFFSRQQIPCRIFETRRRACGQKVLCRSASARLGRIKTSQRVHGINNFNDLSLNIGPK